MFEILFMGSLRLSVSKLIQPGYNVRLYVFIFLHLMIKIQIRLCTYDKKIKHKLRLTLWLAVKYDRAYRLTDFDL